MSSAERVLAQAREIIAEPDRWTKGVFVDTNANGEDCFCALGALTAAENKVGPAPGAYDTLVSQVPSPFRLVMKFNDDPETKHSDVLALFDRAIQAVSA